MSKLTPTQLSLRKLRMEGYAVAMLERWNHFAKLRQDVFGFDIIGVGHDEIVFVQATSWSNVSARLKKLADMETTPLLRGAGARLVVWGWKKKGREHVMRELDVS